jgi:hypothetical protein
LHIGNANTLIPQSYQHASVENLLGFKLATAGKDHSELHDASYCLSKILEPGQVAEENLIEIEGSRKFEAVIDSHQYFLVKLKAVQLIIGNIHALIQIGRGEILRDHSWFYELNKGRVTLMARPRQLRTSSR